MSGSPHSPSAAGLGILLADPRRLDEALGRVERPEETQLFLMDDGVRAASDPRLRALIDEGAEAALCAMDAETRGVASEAGGPRFGSQYDHAAMIRDARRILCFTRAAVEESRPGPDRPRRVAVALASGARDHQVAQALRAAVGYLGCDLRVGIVVGDEAREVVADRPPPALARYLGTLRALGAAFYLPRASPPACDVRVTW